jgi:pimeloyl-ACP methyl ester carboxylesterase
MSDQHYSTAPNPGIGVSGSRILNMRPGSGENFCCGLPLPGCYRRNALSSPLGRRGKPVFYRTLVMLAARSEFITVRKLRYHIRHWGNPAARKLVMLHGWMDVSASFQFVIDNLKREWHVIAPDWRGFGLTDPLPSDTPWFPDYLADLDAILDHYCRDQPATLVGHSMGGNIAMTYAGVRPERVASVVNLEGYGLPPVAPAHAPHRYAEWLDQLRAPPLLRPYANLQEVAQRLQKNNPRLDPARADFLAAHWAKPNAQGQWELLADPAHKIVNPVLYRVEEIVACWRRISAPVLLVEAEQSEILARLGDREQAREQWSNMAVIPKLERKSIAQAGHMLHHDQPELLAHMLEAFLV